MLRRFWVLPVLMFLFLMTVARYQSAELIEVRFTEALYDPPGLDDKNEWFELANVGARQVDLSGFVVTDEEEQGQGEGAVSFPVGTLLETNQVIVVAQNAVAFRERYGWFPDFEIENTADQVTDMGSETRWANGTLALANDGDELILMAPDLSIVVDAVMYGNVTGELLAAFHMPAIPSVQTGQSIERIVPNCDTNGAADWQTNLTPTPGSIPRYGDCPVDPTQYSGDWTRIGNIQGRQDKSPYLNRIVTFRGIVTGKMSDINSSGAIFHSFFVQDEIAHEDGDPLTSDGITVFSGIARPRVEIGDLVAVKGQVIEYFGLTEVGHRELEIAVLAHNQVLPPVVDLGLVYPSAQQDMERYESMLVGLDQAFVIGPTYAGCEFAAMPSTYWHGPIIRHSLNDELQLALGVRNKDDSPCEFFPILNMGDLVSGVLGPLTYTFGQYRIVQQDAPKLTIDQERAIELSSSTTQTDDTGLRVATFNLGNYFDAKRENRDSDEPILTSNELEIKSEKLAYTIGSILDCPDILGVQEVENRALLTILVENLAGNCDHSYEIIHQDGPDSRGMDVAILVNGTKVSLQDFVAHQRCSPIHTAVQDSTVICDPGEYPLFSRPPLEATILVADKYLSVFVNHFKSKREGEHQTRERRLTEAVFLRELVELRAREEPSIQLIVLGDFNDFIRSETAETLLDGDVLQFALGQVPPLELYSYNFSGISQLVDWILVSPTLIPRISNAEIVHVNADYSDALTLRREPPFLGIRSSDHDIPLIDIRLESRINVAKPTLDITQVVSNTGGIEPKITVSTGSNTPDGELPSETYYKGFLIVGSVALIVTVVWMAWIKRKGF